MKFITSLLAALALSTYPSAQCAAQESQAPVRDETRVSGPIQDNSFLIEEAYNQEDGVIQHISYFQRMTNTGNWVYTQTDEWPLRSYKHQLSLTASGAHQGDFQGSGAGWGDTAVNYRYQLIGNGEARLAVAPRLSVLIPTGNHILGRGYGGWGLQTNLPISIQHSEHWVTHWNAGANWVPHAKNSTNETAGVVGVNLGQSVVWLATPRVNLLLETLWTNGQQVTGPGKVAWSQNLYVSPGVRWAYNLRHGLQIVPGVAMPIGIGPSAGEKGVVFYLSFEHPFAYARGKNVEAMQ